MNKLLIENSISEELSGGCFDTFVRHYRKGEMILSQLREKTLTGIVLSGVVLIKSVNSEGEESLIDICTQGDAFGGGLFPEYGLGSCYAVAKKPCCISYANYQKLIRSCEKNCEKHALLIDELFGRAIRRTMMHVDVLSRRSIREKLLAYFRYVFEGTSGSGELPVSLSELADYLCCDRSAMMRELRKLNESGEVLSKGSHISLSGRQMPNTKGKLS